MALMHEDQGRYKTFTRRTLLLGGGQALLLSTLVGRMYYLQIQEAERYKTLAEDNRINLRLLPPPRGRILDRFGLPLALNQQVYRLLLTREQVPDLEASLAALAEIIPLTEKDRERLLREAHGKRAFVPVTIRDNLTWQQVSQIEVNAPDLPGISIEVGQTRYYPYRNALVQVLGYVAEVAERDLTGEPLLELPGFRIGKSGIERQLDLDLRGSAGTSQVEVNAFGRVIRELSRDEGEPGREPILTLDVGLQNFAHQRLMGKRAAATVVMDVQNGDILALVSVPSFDPSPFSIGITAREWNQIVGDPMEPLNNRAVSGLYAPGSTFKMCVALAALESGTSPQTRYFCRGYLDFGNARFHCWKKQGHGWMDMHNGIKQSCDVFFYETGRRTGIDRMAAMARRFGLGATSDLGLPGEKDGMIPTRDWKLATFGEPWQGGETLISAIGQGFVLATPLQLAVMVARIASGRAIQPRLTRGFLASAQEADGELQEDPTFESLGIPEPYMQIVRRGMDAVVNEPGGTAYGKRIKEEGWEMAGKTGTSQVRRITMAERRAGKGKKKEVPWRFRDHALFVSFAPVQAPRYCCAVLVEHGGGGSRTAAPIAHDILLETQRRDPSGSAALAMMAGARVKES